MNDVIETGRPDRPRRNGMWFGAGAAALLVIGLAVTTLHPETTAAKASASPTPPVSVPPLETYQPVPDTPEESSVPEPARPPAEWDMTALTERTGLTLAGPADGLVLLDVDTREMETRTVPGDATVPVRPVAAIPGGWLVMRSTACGDPPCPPAEIYAVRRRGRPTVLITHGDLAKPDPDGATVWVTGLEHPEADQDPAASTHWLERWTFGGKRVGPHTLLRPGEDLIGITPRGPVVSTYDGFGPVTVVSATTRARTRLVRNGQGGAVAGYLVAWTSPGCDATTTGDCSVFLTDARTGRTRSVGHLSRMPNVAALDPTGRYLAAGSAPYEEGVPAVVEVLDTRNGTLVPLGGTSDQRPAAESMTWSPDGRWLVLTHERYGDGGLFVGHTVALWRPGHGLVGGPVYPGAADDAFAVAGQ